MTPASVRKYYVVTLRGERGPLDRAELKELVDSGEAQLTDRVRTATGRQLGTVAEMLSDSRAKETAELDPPTMDTAEAIPVAMAQRVSARKRGSGSISKEQRLWMIIAAMSVVVMVAIIWGVWAVTHSAPPVVVVETPRPTPAPTPATTPTPPKPRGGMVAVGGDMPVNTPGSPRQDPVPVARDPVTPPTPVPVPTPTPQTPVVVAPVPKPTPIAPLPTPPPAPMVPVSLTDPSTWLSADIGGGSPAGNGPVAADGGRWRLASAGGDIFANEDQFRFNALALAEDGSVTARIVAFTGKHRFDKAGVMLRAGDGPDAPMLLIAVNHDGFIEVLERENPREFCRQTFRDQSSSAMGCWLRVSRDGDICKAETSGDGVSWNRRSAINVAALGGPLLAGLAVCSHQSGALATATFDHVSAVGGSTPPRPTASVQNDPAAWPAWDVGGGLAGSGPTLAGGQYTMVAAGADIYHADDQFRFAATPLAGDGSITMRVAAFSGIHRSGKVGLMLRADSTTSAPFFLINVNHDGQMECLSRAQAGAECTAPGWNEAMHPFPYWMRLTRQGTTCTAWISDDGQIWQPKATIALAGRLLAGVAVCSHQADTTATAVFDNVAVVADAPSAAPAQAAGAYIDVCLPRTIGIIAARGGTNPDDIPELAFDRNPATRWLDVFGTLDPVHGVLSYLQFVFRDGVPRHLVAYAVTSAGDLPERDPRSWRVVAINPDNSTTVIDERRDEGFPKRGLRRVFTLASPVPVSQIRLEITAINNPQLANGVQIAEFELLDAAASAPPPP